MISWLPYGILWFGYLRMRAPYFSVPVLRMLDESSLIFFRRFYLTCCWKKPRGFRDLLIHLVNPWEPPPTSHCCFKASCFSKLSEIIHKYLNQSIAKQLIILFTCSFTRKLFRKWGALFFKEILPYLSRHKAWTTQRTVENRTFPSAYTSTRETRV